MYLRGLTTERDQERRVYQANGTPTALPRTPVFRLNICVLETYICKQTCEEAACGSFAYVP